MDYTSQWLSGECWQVWSCSDKTIEGIHVMSPYTEVARYLFVYIYHSSLHSSQPLVLSQSDISAYCLYWNSCHGYSQHWDIDDVRLPFSRTLSGQWIWENCSLAPCHHHVCFLTFTSLCGCFHPAVQASWRPGCLSWCWWASSLQWPWPSTSGDLGGRFMTKWNPCRSDVELTF